MSVTDQRPDLSDVFTAADELRRLIRGLRILENDREGLLRVVSKLEKGAIRAYLHKSRGITE